MKLQLLIAIGHQDYMEHLSDVLTQRYGETFEVSVCSTGERLRELLSRKRFDAALLAYECERETTLKAALRAHGPGTLRRVALIIGPEGGFEPEEAALLAARGARAVTLGPRILRTETAGMAMLAQTLYELEQAEG